MKNTILIICCSINLVCRAQNCINFNGGYNLSNWIPTNTAAHSIQNDPSHGNYLQLIDDDYGSFEENKIDFSGNWLLKAPNGCFCFDYRAKWDAQWGNTPAYAPKLALTYKDPVTNNIYRAQFLGNTTNIPVQNNQWANFCLPIDSCRNGVIPFNNYGYWKIDLNGNFLSGNNACTIWNKLITNVHSFILYTDYNPSPSEVISFDNFCWSCATLPCDLNFSTTSQNAKCFNEKGSINYNVSNGALPYIVFLNGALIPSSGTLQNLNGGIYAFNITDNNGCSKTKIIELLQEPCPPDPCCANTLSMVTPTAVPPSYLGDGFTYSVEAFNVNVPNNIPITQIKVNVESFELFSNNPDCKTCNTNNVYNGSILGLPEIGSGINTLTVTSASNNLTENSNYNEVVWENKNGALLNNNDMMQLIYILPLSKNISCCIDSAKVCIRISYYDVNCGHCELFNCSNIYLTNYEKEQIRLAHEGRGIVIKPNGNTNENSELNAKKVEVHQFLKSKMSNQFITPKSN